MFFRALNLCFWLIFLCCFSAFSQPETLTITTYYPAPFGIYNRLVTSTLGVGDNSASGGLDGADAPDPVTQTGDVWIVADVGISTTTPQNRLDVAGSAAIGATYAGTQAAPLNGLLVEGDVGVGLAAANLPPNADLEAGAIRLVPTNQAPVASTGLAQDLQGSLYYSNAAGDTGLKFYDGNIWKKLGSLELGPESAPIQSNPALFEQDTFPVEISARCPAGSMVTGVRVWTAGGCPSSCGSFFHAGRILRIGVVCKALQ
ncbi:MAG: hypothetical protein Q8O30_04920 [Candidatus Omnitrophota bacterium]|nr:hypothetical protein [Candidatus Omnitrophota bacterium]